MTKTTDTRQLRMTIDSILAKYEIDNLQLSMDLSTAARTFFDETKQGKNPVEVRLGIEQALQAGKLIAAQSEEMETRIKMSTGLSVNDRWHMDGVIKFLLKKDKEGQTIEKYAEACKKDPFGMPKFFKIAEKPTVIIDTWGLAFSHKTDEVRPEYKIVVPDDSKAVPNPYRKPVVK